MCSPPSFPFRLLLVRSVSDLALSACGKPERSSAGSVMVHSKLSLFPAAQLSLLSLACWPDRLFCVSEDEAPKTFLPVDGRHPVTSNEELGAAFVISHPRRYAIV